MKSKRMSRGAFAVVLVGLLTASVNVRLASDPPPAAPVSERSVLEPATGAILVDLDDDADEDDRGRVARLLAAAIAPFDWSVSGQGLGTPLSEAAQLYRVMPPPSEVRDILEGLANDEDVEGVEIERVWRLPESAMATVHAAHADDVDDVEGARRGRFVPDDPYYKHQWHLDQIQMPEAWTQQRGRGVVVAVVDTGVSYRDSGRFRRAPDLAFDRLVSGYDFVDRDRFPDDEHGHGTHVAGTVAQSTNNGLGVAGVAPDARIMPVRVLDARGAGRWGSVAAGIRWAADNGADVINLSLGGGLPSSSIRRAIEHAHRRGVVVVAAAGNTGRGSVQYPAAHANVIAVGAVRFDGELSFYSSYGRHLDVVAPGGDLRVDQNGDGLPDGVLQNTIVGGDPSRHDYVAFQGTSMAAPHVAGVAALLRASGVRDPATIERILERTARSKTDRRKYGAGIIQANSALRVANQGLGGLRGLTAGLLSLFVFFGLARRRKLGVGRRSTAAIAVVVAGGLSMLPLHWLGAWAVGLGAGLPSLFAATGPWGSLALLSAVVPFGLLALLLNAKKARPLTVGVALGFAGWLVVEALVPTTPLALLPALVVGPWLLVQAGAALWVARAAATDA